MLKRFFCSGWGRSQQNPLKEPNILLYSVREAAALKDCKDAWAKHNVNIAFDKKDMHKY